MLCVCLLLCAHAAAPGHQPPHSRSRLAGISPTGSHPAGSAEGDHQHGPAHPGGRRKGPSKGPFPQMDKSTSSYRGVSYGDSGRSYVDIRRTRTSDGTESPGCYYEGSWYAAGSAVRLRDACLSCACTQGALSCRRVSCELPRSPPPHCYLVHRRGECCPQIHCPDKITYLERAASSRTDDPYINMPSSIGHACVEGGTIFAAGSAMNSNVACEQCFCLGGKRRCVRPRCLTPPPGCTARPSSGACCPQRYYCVHSITKPPSETYSHDCITSKRKSVVEGSRVKESEDSDCIQCFCLHGSIRCQHLSCAPTLHGCKPLVQPGQCCALQYMCDHSINGTKLQNLSLDQRNLLIPLKEETRLFHISKSTKRETKEVLSVTEKSTAAVTVTKEEPFKSTTKIKRKIEEILITDTVAVDKVDTTIVIPTQTTQNNNDITSTITTEMAQDSEKNTTEQPEDSVKIIINGTINCTAELSSTSLFLNVTDAIDRIWIQNEGQPRIPFIDKIDNLDHTFSPNDILTEGNHDVNFDENESFTINVTSSLKTNSTRTSPSTISSTALPKTVLPALLAADNVSKTKNEEYDYDYTEPTLPPSLPNLKIIPFVAADAVVEDDMSSKEMPSYSSITKEDKFPVYYPTNDSKETTFASRREYTYNLTHYSIYAPEKDEPEYPGIIQNENPVKVAYPSISDVARQDGPLEYAVSASFGNPIKITSNINSESIPLSKYDVETPDSNLFSPPVETEGGFVPKDPELIDDYYSIYQTTPLGIIPHLTTSMTLNTKDECMSDDGRRVSDGESISDECTVCSCAWGVLHCSPRPCHTPPGCKRQTDVKHTGDAKCCGELSCDRVDKTTKPSIILTSGFQENLNIKEVAPVLEDKININVTQKQHASFMIDASNNNATLNNTTMDQVFEDKLNDTLLETATKSFVTNGLVLNTTTSDTANDPPPHNDHSLDYDVEDDDDEGFSLGSVLKLLLSETYETTTAAPKNRPKNRTRPLKVVTTTVTPTTERKQLNISPFVPITQHYPYNPPKHTVHLFNTVERIDHLVLGEASAIRTTSSRPPISYRPVTYTAPRRTSTTTTTRRSVTTKAVEINSKEGYVSQSVEKQPPPNMFSGLGLGLPKLDGCNIYGRMYRVGRIIPELSSTCRECTCTELGVQCRALTC